MKKLSAYLTAMGLVCGVSMTGFAHEAPVVSASQQQQTDAAVSTQAEAPTGGSWQPVADASSTPAAAASSTSSDSTSEWQPVNAQPSQPAAQSSDQTAENAAPANNDAQQLSDNTPAPTGSVSKRVARLEQQIANYNQMNLPQQVTNLQQKNAELEGQLEVAQHNLKAVTANQKLYYQDLEQQIAQLEKAKGVKPTTTLADNTDNTSSAKTAQNANGFVEKTSAPDDDSQLTSGTPSENTAQNTSDTQLATATQAAPAPINLLKKDRMPSLSDADTYGKAFRSLSDKHFDQAQKEFQTYLSEYPKGRFAVNAHFWMGEIALMHEKYDVAKKQFQTVVAEYPSSPKVSDAKLKIAMINAAQGKMDLARREFTQIRKLYPGSTAAQLASIRLQQLANATSVSVQ